MKENMGKTRIMAKTVASRKILVGINKGKKKSKEETAKTVLTRTNRHRTSDS